MTRLVPGRDDLADAAFLTALFVVALLGFHGTYSDWGFLLVGCAGLLLGVVSGHVASVLRRPMIAVAVMTVAVFFLLGGAVAMRGSGAVPTPATMSDLAGLGVHGWKQLLTTLPPVDGTGPLLVLPYILGLLCGAGGFTLARRVSLSAAPAGAPLAVLVVVILLGTGEATGLLGALFAAIGTGWTAVRAARRRTGARVSGVRVTRAVTAVALAGVAAGLVLLVSPALPGTGSADRLVLRNYVEPPFEVGAYASPLVGYRKHTKDANQLWDQTLFTVEGLPEGGRVRIATLDGYDGRVWGATNDPSGAAGPLQRNNFQRIGVRIPVAGTGAEADVTVRIEAAYATADELSAWLPTAGQAREIAFDGERKAGHTESLRYNLATASGIVADRLKEGDTYRLRTVLPAAGVPDDAQPFGRPSVRTGDLAFVRSKVAKWTGGATTIAERLKAAATYLRDNGAYTDGGPGETEYLPGHSAARLTAFFNAKRPAGNDEQYAAAYALVANEIGMPARVVLGAVPGSGGVVRGENVQAWVEIHLADGTWAAIPNTEYMPDRSKKPDHQPPQEIENTDAAVVPPPNTVKMPSSLVDASRTDVNGITTPPIAPPFFPLWLRELLADVGTVVLPVLALVGLVVGAKTTRRHRRRTRGSTPTRFATGWRELVDHARDLGATVPRGLTRRQEATRLQERFDLRGLAAAADAQVFGPGTPDQAAVDAYWAAVREARSRMRASVPWWRRWLAAVDVRTFLPVRSR
ncbi:transglutaminase-like domain-containing protein [Lentzea sp. NPDC058450]|uniref:transglutaminase-like domain-containing protein n=1 Tax=Lentzea sp. NPDC058450 TaxID=3346505 RepID=UPI003653B562